MSNKTWSSAPEPFSGKGDPAADAAEAEADAKAAEAAQATPPADPDAAARRARAAAFHAEVAKLAPSVDPVVLRGLLRVAEDDGHDIAPEHATVELAAAALERLKTLAPAALAEPTRDRPMQYREALRRPPAGPQGLGAWLDSLKKR